MSFTFNILTYNWGINPSKDYYYVIDKFIDFIYILILIMKKQVK